MTEDEVVANYLIELSKWELTLPVTGKEHNAEAMRYAASLLRKIASGEYVPVVHAHWTNKNDENVYVCSNCGHYCREFLIQQSGNIPIQGFCTECGAKMDEEENYNETT